MRKHLKVRHMATQAVRFARTQPIAARYAVDGLLISAAVNTVANNNNLFASRLGADDFQLSLLQFLPQLMNMLVLIPGGLLIDRLHNKRRMVTGMLFVSAFLYACMGCAPLLPLDPLVMFIGLLSLTTGMVMLFNIAWQSYFPDVVEVTARNRVLTIRTRVVVFMGMLASLTTGALLSRIGTDAGKITAHQGFFFFAAVLMVVAAINFRRFEPVAKAAKPNASTDTAPTVQKTHRSLFRNKAFLWFVGTALFFYFTWQIDWTLYYIGQVQYLHMNEWLLGLATVGATGIQFVTLRFWSRLNDKHGVVLPVTFGILGLGLCPISMIAAVSLPASIGPYAFVLFNTIANIAFVTITLNIFQCLLPVLDEENRSLSISVFTCLTCFSNAVMPVAGVALYRALGGDLHALRLTFWIVFCLRVVAAGLWLVRWRLMQKPARPR